MLSGIVWPSFIPIGEIRIVYFEPAEVGTIFMEVIETNPQATAATRQIQSCKDETFSKVNISIQTNSGSRDETTRDWNLKWAVWVTSCSRKHSPRTSAWATAWVNAFIKWTYFCLCEWKCTQKLICVSCACKRATAHVKFQSLQTPFSKAYHIISSGASKPSLRCH